MSTAPAAAAAAPAAAKAPEGASSEQTVMQGKEENKDGAKVTLYWLNKSRSQRILWLLEELGINYDLKTFKRTQAMTAPPELKEVHPLGKSPVVTISCASSGVDEKKPLVLAESSFIIEYLIEHFGEWLAPKKWREGMEGKVGGETEGWLRYRYYMSYGEGSLMPFLWMGLIMGIIKTSSPFLVKPITGLITGNVDAKLVAPNLKSNYQYLESQLASAPQSGPYLCGPELTGADILLSFPLGAARGGRAGGFSKEAYPLLWAYVGRLQEREGYKRAVEKIVQVEGSYDASL